MAHRHVEIPIYISARHVHLSREHLEQLFGPGHALQLKTGLRQPGQFAAQETVTLQGPRGPIPNVRVLGPCRSHTQVEISRTDGLALGIDAPIRRSGELEGSPGLRLNGPAGTLDLPQGVIQAQRHIHMSPAEAAGFGLKDGDYVMVRVGGVRGVIFDDVLVRVDPAYLLEMHLDTDEANAADLASGELGQLIPGPITVAPDPED